MNHVSGSRAGIVGVYQRHGWETEKRAALDAWAAHVIRLAEDNSNMPGNVADMAQARVRRARRKAGG
jgi:hypothetical protein